MIVSMLEYDEEGTLDMSSIHPIVDGGTEGFKGNARVILPGVSACIECTLELYPPQVIYCVACVNKIYLPTLLTEKINMFVLYEVCKKEEEKQGTQ